MLLSVSAALALLSPPAAMRLRHQPPRMVVGEEAARARWLNKLDNSPSWGSVQRREGRMEENVRGVVVPAPPARSASEDAAKRAWLASLDAPSWGQAAAAMMDDCEQGDDLACDDLLTATKEEEAKRVWMASQASAQAQYDARAAARRAEKQALVADIKILAARVAARVENVRAARARVLRIGRSAPDIFFAGLDNLVNEPLGWLSGQPSALKSTLYGPPVAHFVGGASAPTEGDDLMQKVKDAGVAGAIAYAGWELIFWSASVPMGLVAYYGVTGHFPDTANPDDMAQLGAEAFAFVNMARFAVPLRIGLALSSVPFVQAQILDRFARKDRDDWK